MAKPWSEERKQAYENKRNSICKTEDMNDELQTPIEQYSNNMRMDEDDRLQNMLNTIKILPPNMIVDGRHRKENIEAICGFKISDELMDKLYANFVHEPY